MKSRLALLITLACGLLLATPAFAADDALPPERITFEQYGPSDSTLMPVALAVGKPESSTRKLILVTQERFTNILGMVKNGNTAPPKNPVPGQTSEATYYQNDKPAGVHYIPQSNVVSLLEKQLYHRRK